MHTECAVPAGTPPKGGKKGVNWIVRICCLCALIRGLQNLGASCKGDVFRAFRLYEKNQKYTRGSHTSISLKHGRLAHVRSQFSLFRRSPTHKNLPPATFCTSEQLFSAFCKKQKKLWHFLPKCDILQKIINHCGRMEDSSICPTTAFTNRL